MTIAPTQELTDYMLTIPVSIVVNLDFEAPEGLNPEEATKFVLEHLGKTRIEEVWDRADIIHTLQTKDPNSFDLRRYNEETTDYDVFDPETKTWEEYWPT